MVSTSSARMLECVGALAASRFSAGSSCDSFPWVSSNGVSLRLPPDRTPGLPLNDRGCRVAHRCTGVALRQPRRAPCRDRPAAAAKPSKPGASQQFVSRLHISGRVQFVSSTQHFVSSRQQPKPCAWLQQNDPDGGQAPPPCAAVQQTPPSGLHASSPDSAGQHSSPLGQHAVLLPAAQQTGDPAGQHAVEKAAGQIVSSTGQTGGGGGDGGAGGAGGSGGGEIGQDPSVSPWPRCAFFCFLLTVIICPS